MSIVVLLPFLLGAALGTRFKVLVLVPAIWATVIVFLLTGLTGGSNVAAICIDAGLSAISLQIGYLSAIFIRFSLAPAATGPLAKISRSA